MPETSPQKPADRRIERLLATAALLICLVVDVLVWQQISQQQPIWPLPGLYLVEVFLFCAAGAYAIYLASLNEGWIVWLAWVASGVVLGLALVSAWSIGFLYLPVWAVLLAAGVISARHQKMPGLGLFILHVASAVLEAGLILWVASRVLP
jgi:hypothetical protein